MEWMHLEPITCENMSAPDQTCIINEKNYEAEKIHSDIVIDSLKRENIRLRRIIKRLKFRLKIRQIPKKRTSKKVKKKKIIQDLVDEQELHPLAKAMINLQLHTPHAPYTEQKKILSKQLFYYSAAALRRL